MRGVLPFAAALFAVCVGALFVLTPSVAQAQSCGMGNPCAQVTALSVSMTPAPAGEGLTVTCSASDANGVVTGFSLTASDGVFGNGLSTIDVDAAPMGPSASVTVDWTAPTTVGATAVLSCAAWDNGGMVGKPTKGPAVTLDVPIAQANPNLPKITFITTDLEAFPNEDVVIAAIIEDPTGNTPTLTWAAMDGVVSGDNDADPERIVWTAPGTLGSFGVTLTASGVGGTARRTLFVPVVLAKVGRPMTVPDGGVNFRPWGVATDAAGQVYVTNPRQGAIYHFTPVGGLTRVQMVGGHPAGLAIGPDGVLWVGDVSSGSVTGYNPAGDVVDLLGRGVGEFKAPNDIAIAQDTGQIFVTDGRTATISAYDRSGTRTGSFTLPAAFQDTSIAANDAGTLLAVANGNAGEVTLFTPAGTLVRTFGAGSLSRSTGVAFGPGDQIFVADAFQGSLIAFDVNGVELDTIATYGVLDGQLRIPLDVAVSPRGQLLVVDTSNYRITTFELPGSNVGCVDDTDCDGLPNAWEVANGLDPNSAQDAHADTDGDGLSNLEEFALGTNPYLADTDGDGIADGAEIADGMDPLDETDNRPTVDAGPQVLTQPTLYTLTATGGDPNGDPLTFAWRQLGGPVPVDGLSGDAPSVVLRTAGTYLFEVTTSDGSGISRPGVLAVVVEDVAPKADAGPDFGVLLGMSVTLDGRFSVDANGDSISYTWTQVGGPPATITQPLSARPSFAPWTMGTYTLALEVDDAGHPPTGAAQRRDLVTITVDAPNQHVPVAVVPERIDAIEGDTVILTGATSIDTDADTLSFSWTQVGGAAVALERSDTAYARFVANAAGVTTFALTVDDGGRTSAPQEVVVVIDAPSNALPRTDAGADQRVQNLSVVHLDCSASLDADSDPVSCAWTQVVGAPTPLTWLDDTHTSFIPIDPGVYVFEATASDALHAGTTDRVTIVVDDATTNHVPVAAIAGVAGVAPGSAVTLDGTGSTDADGGSPLGAVWTQVAGPRAPLTDTFAAMTAFTPTLPGTYAFELRVEDGKHQSPAATVFVEAACGLGAYGADCGVLCDTTTSCGGHGACAATGACFCDTGYDGADCGVLTCGDGVIVGNEECDDGGSSATCNANCTFVVCGDGVTNAAAGEACDDGAESAACDADCTVAECGDGIVNTTAGEVCDDGAANSDATSNACRTSCTRAVCGDGVVDSDEGCDDGTANSNTEPDACRWTAGRVGGRRLGQCVHAFCGDGVVDTGEACDDGQNNGDDPGSCRRDCSLPGCGDGILDPGEACDAGVDNSDIEPDRCRTNCLAPTCGDSVLDQGEACDDGAENSDTEPNACRWGSALTDACVPAHCGDAVVDLGESCDDGATNSDSTNATCRMNCALATCGNGILDPGEACDDGEANSDATPDGCRSTCVLPWCGDGVVDDDEGCDDGAKNGDQAACPTSCERVGEDTSASDVGDAEDASAAEVLEGVGALGGGNDCGCSTVRGGAGGAGALASMFALLALVCVRRRGRRREGGLMSARNLLSNLLALTVCTVASSADASDPPHWLNPDGASLIDCTSQCHIGHNSLGGQLTRKATNFNLCESCHIGGGVAENFSIALADRAVLGVSGTSHGFGVDATNAGAGALPPQNPQMLVRLDGTQITCSTCHNQHRSSKSTGGRARLSPATQTLGGGTGSVTPGGTYTGDHGVWFVIAISSGNASFEVRDDTFASSGPIASGGPFAASGTQALAYGVTATFTPGFGATETWEFSASYSFLRLPLDTGDNTAGNKFCRDCHRQLINAAGSVKTYTGQKMSHPVGIVVPAGNYHNPPLDADLRPQGAGSSDTNASNDLVLLGAGGDEVQCITCHAMHFADSNSLTP